MSDFKKENEQTIYPHFIQNAPCGEDKYEGGSQKRLATVIAHYIKNNDFLQNEKPLPRIIGIKGEWGSGKSNVILQLQKELREDYYFFNYDAWGHQEDLQRRSILELLTDNLIKNNVLSGNSKINIKGGGEKTVSWNEKLKYLLARKTETVTEKYPKINCGIVAAALVAMLTPIFTFIAYFFQFEDKTLLTNILSIAISAFPLIISLIVWFIAHEIDPKYNFNYFLAIYSDKIENDICYETLSEDEPTVKEFKDWMSDISDFIGKNKDSNKKSKLVIVFDNMDRLPNEKVKELWSSIHTFFAEDGFENIWAIIPFDEKHLCRAFANEIETTKCFINKTFPVVYRVTPPVITDFRKIIDDLFIEAFGDTEDEHKEIINRIFRLLTPNATVRDIITFINATVALKQEYEKEISLINIAVFYLKQDQILKEPDKQILSGEYLKEIKDIIDNNDKTQEEIAALVYGINIGQARQIPLTKYIKNCIEFEPSYDINEHSESNVQFDNILEEVFYNEDDEKLDNMIKCLDKLKKSNNHIEKIWDNIASRKLKQSLEKHELSNEYKILLTHCTIKQKLVDSLYYKLQTFNEFKGSSYFSSLEAINNIITENKFDCSLNDNSEILISTENFIDYIRESKEKYDKYKVSTDSKELENYLISKLEDDAYDFSNIVSILQQDKNYNFKTLKSKIEEFIKDKKTSEKNVAKIFNTYKLLYGDKPLKVKLTSQEVVVIHNSMINSKQNIVGTGYADIVAMAFSYGNNISVSDEKNIIKEIAEVMDYYSNYGNMLINSVVWSIPSLSTVLKYMTENKIGERLAIANILPKYESIKARINVTDEDFINHLDCWSEHIPESIAEENLQQIVPHTLYKVLEEFNNDLTQKINAIAENALKNVPSDELYSQKTAINSYYWHIVANYLITRNYIKELPENVMDFVKNIFTDIANNAQTLPLQDYYTKLIEKIDGKRLGTCFTNIRDLFCNSQANINTEKFKILEKWLREYGLLDERKETASKILNPVITDQDCRKIILDNSEFYISLINNAGNFADEFKQTVEKLAQENTDDERLKEFAKETELTLKLD